MSNIAEIEGIGPASAEKLEAIGIKTVEGLLEKGASKDGREEIATASGASEADVATWVKHADLMRVKGVGPQFSELLQAAGVDSVPELAERNAENLAAKLDEVNAEKNLTNRVPNAEALAEMIEFAKGLTRVITH